MDFLKETMSSKFVTLLEELLIEHKYINIFKYQIKFLIFDYSNKFKAKKKQTNLELAKDLFKERLYLEQLRDIYYVNDKSRLFDNTINNIIISEISYGNGIHLHLEYSIASEEFSIYVIIGTKSVMISEENLKINSINEVFNSVLNLLYTDIGLILTNMLISAIRKIRKEKANV